MKLLDAELARLREETGTPMGLLPHGLDKIVGSFRGDADFEAAMKLGAKWRSSFRPKRKFQVLRWARVSRTDRVGEPTSIISR